MKVFTKTKLLSFLTILCISSLTAQFRVLPTGTFFSKGNTVVYSNEETTNDGTLSFETGKLIVDKNFTNNSPTSSTTLGTPFFNMTRATLQVGGGGTVSNTAQTLNFRDFPAYTPGGASSSFSNNVHTPITGFDQILHLIVNKTGGNVSVDRGSLHLTSLDPLTTGDGLSTLAVLSSTVLNANQRVTMRSSSVENTAVVAPSHTNASVNDVIVERYIPRNATWNSTTTSTRGRSWRFLSPTTTGGTINSNWQEGASNPTHLPATDSTWGPTSVPTSGVNNNPVPGFGTHITGGTTNGLDSQPSQGASLFQFSNTGLQWNSILNTTGTNFVAGSPYRILVRGTRSNNLNFNNSVAENTILRSKGALYFGSYEQIATAPNPSSKFIFGNAYQSAVDLNAATKVNLKNSMRVWDATLGVTGSWVTVDLVNNLSTGGSSMTRILQPGQGFEVEADAAGPISLTFNESNRIVDEDLSTVFDQSTLKRIDLRLYTQHNFSNNLNAHAGIFIDFSVNGNNNYDFSDYGHTNNTDESIASVSDDNILASIQNRNMPQDNEIVALQISRYRTQNYTFRLFLDEYLGKDAFLKDNFTLTETPIEVGQATIYNFSIDNQITESIAPNRFDIVFRNNLSVEVPFGSNFALYPNPNTIDKFFISTQGLIGESVKISIVNMLGQVVSTTKQNVPTDGIVEVKSDYLAEGVYNVTLTSENDQKYSAKLIKNN